MADSFAQSHGGFSSPVRNIFSIIDEEKPRVKKNLGQNEVVQDKPGLEAYGPQEMRKEILTPLP